MMFADGAWGGEIKEVAGMMHRPGQKTGFPGFPLEVGLKKGLV